MTTEQPSPAGSGLFFSFDGLDGVGKSTQIELFCDWLREQAHDVVVCRDPGSTPLGEQLREIVLHSSVQTSIGPRSEMLLYMAARAQLVDDVIRPALATGRTVVSDRFLLANVVYQGHAGGLDPETLWQVGAVATAGIEPDLTFLLDLPHEATHARIQRPLDRIERRGGDFRERLRAGFLIEAERCERIVVIDASQSIEGVQAAVRTAASTLLRNH